MKKVKKAPNAPSGENIDDVGEKRKAEMKMKDRDGKAPKAPNAPRGKMKKCRGVGADKFNAPRKKSWSIGAYR